MWSHLKDNGIKLPKITAEEIDKEVMPVLRDMESFGIKLDVSVLEKMAKRVERRLGQIEHKIHSLAKEDFNINSPVQMADILFDKLKLPTKELKRTKSGFSTAAGELKKIENEHKIIKPILEYRELSKLLSTYLKPLPLLADENFKLHTTYGQDTSTGRITSQEPNLQNIPIKNDYGTEIRKAFVAEEGNKLVAADYSQIELRIVACLADDSAMKESFKSGEDIHTKTAAEIFNIDVKKVTEKERRVAKTVNFGVLYGMSPYGLSQALSIGQEEAASYIKKYFEIHKGIRAYCDNMIDFAQKNGYVETLFGFKRKFPNINSSVHNVALAEERMAINAPVQGTAAEVLKLAMIKLYKELSDFRLKKKDDYPRLLLTIHDELVVETREKEAQKIAQLVKKIMESAIILCVPLSVEVEIGKNLGAMNKFNLLV